MSILKIKESFLNEKNLALVRTSAERRILVKRKPPLEGGPMPEQH